MIPVFDPPEIIEQANETTQTFKRSYYFDFETGDFRTDGGNRVLSATGYDAWVQWCIKAVQTERYACIAYPDNYGAELDDVRNQPNRKAAESAMARTITETLTQHPMTESVRGFSHSWDSDGLITTFTVYPRDGAPVEVTTQA